MKKAKRWFQMITLGQTKTYGKLLLWNLFDSFVTSIPLTIMLMVIYLLLIPAAQPGVPLSTMHVWLLWIILLIQFISYNFLRRKTYIDFCVGFAGTTKISRIQMGEHLRRLSMGFFNNRDAGDLSTVLLRDYTEIENLSQQILPQIATILIRYAFAVIILSAFDWRMMLAVFAVIPIALPFAFLSYRSMSHVSADLQRSQQEAASGILEYVGGIQTLRAFHMAGERFESLKTSLNHQRKEAIRLENRSAAPLGMLGRFVLNSGIALVMLIGAALLMDEALSPFYYIVFLIMTLTLYDPMLLLFTLIADFSRTTRSGKRIETLFGEKPLSEPAVGKCPMHMNLEFSHVSFSYGKKKFCIISACVFRKKA